MMKTTYLSAQYGLPVEKLQKKKPSLILLLKDSLNMPQTMKTTKKSIWLSKTTRSSTNYPKIIRPNTTEATGMLCHLNKRYLGWSSIMDG